MSWSTIRRATDSDTRALRQAAERFCKRHQLEVTAETTPEFEIDCALYPGSGCSYEAEDRARRLKRLWARIVRKTLGTNAEGIAYGYVGFHVK